MRQAVLLEPRRIELITRPVPAPGPGEVLLRVRAALTCGTDLKTYRRGDPPAPRTAARAGVAPRAAAVSGGGAASGAPGARAGHRPAPGSACFAWRRGSLNPPQAR